MRTDRGTPGLPENARGSIIIVTLFAASFIIGLIFGMHGIGHALHTGDAKRDAVKQHPRAVSLGHLLQADQVRHHRGPASRSLMPCFPR